MMHGKILIAVGLALLVTALMWWLVGSLSGSTELLTVPVRRGDFIVRVTAAGRLEADNAIRVEARAHGSIVTYLAPEGSMVKTGDVLARFDDTTLRERVLTRRNDWRMAKARLAEKQQQMAVRRQEIVAQMAVLKADLEIRRTEHKRLKSLPHPDDVTRAELERDYRLSRLRIAEQDLDNIRSLAGAGAQIFSREEMREKELAHTEAKGELDKAENLLRQVKQGADKGELDAAQRELNKARIALDEALESEAQKFSGLKSDVAAAEAGVEKMKARLDRTQKRLDELEVKSPGAGMLVYRTLHGKPLELGTQVWHRAHLFDIASLGSMVVRAKVKESEFARIKAGRPAEVRVFSLPDQTFTGKVIEVAKVAKDKSEGELKRWGQNETSGIQVVDVLVHINESSAFLRPNVDAEVVILCEEVPDVLSVPIDAVSEEKGEHVVRVLEGHRVRKRPVTLGARDRDWVAVTDGLKAGERVVLEGAGKRGRSR